jgi:hypothetical protein
MGLPTAKRPPLPPPDRYYIAGRRVMTYKEVSFILKSKTLSGDLLRLEISWRVFKRSLILTIKPILDYLK